jgi:hypothetical protein
MSPSRIGLRRTWPSARLTAGGGPVSAWAGGELPECAVWSRSVDMMQIDITPAEAGHHKIREGDSSSRCHLAAYRGYRSSGPSSRAISRKSFLQIRGVGVAAATADWGLPPRRCRGARLGSTDHGDGRTHRNHLVQDLPGAADWLRHAPALGELRLKPTLLLIATQQRGRVEQRLTMWNRQNFTDLLS